MDNAQFLTTGFVTAAQKGPLSVTMLTPTELVIVEVISGGPAIAGRLQSGEPPADVLGSLSAFNRTEQRIPIARLQSAQWTEGHNGLRFSWIDEAGRVRHKTTQISRPAERTRLLEELATQLGHRPQETTKPAGVLAVAWSQLLGAVIAVVGTVFFVAMWDPQALAKIRNGHLALMLGPTGCMLVGSGIAVACLYSAWKRLVPRPVEHRWVV
jgi:hypothetical protein